MSGPLHGLGRTVRVHRHGCAHGVVLRQAHSRGRLDPPAGSPADLQDEGRSVAGHECCRGPLGDDVTVVQDGEPVDRPLGLPHVVGHQEDRRAGLGQKADLVPQQAPAYRVDIIGGLIEDDQAPGDDGAHGEGSQTGNTAGDLLRGSPRPLPQVEGLDELLGAPARLTRAPSSHTPHEVDRRQGRESCDGHIGLSLDIGETTGESGVGDGVDPVEPDAPGGRAQQPHHLVDQRGLARAVVPEEPDHLAGTHPHGDAGVGSHRVRPASEVLVKVLDG